MSKIENIVGWSVAGLLLAAGAVGYALNLISLFSAEGAGEIALRVIGVLVPLIGAVVGYF